MNNSRDYEWKPWLFEKAAQGYWKHAKNQRDYLDKMFKELNLKTWEDWYQVKVR